MRSPDDDLWALVHAERAALAQDLSGLDDEQWRWMRSMLAARFRVDVHNQRRMLEHRRSTSAETLDRFRAIIDSTTAPSSHIPAYLGEVVVQANDIRHPLGLTRTPDVDALTPVAEFFARRNFAVPS